MQSLMRSSRSTVDGSDATHTNPGFLTAPHSSVRARTHQGQSPWLVALSAMIALGAAHAPVFAQNTTWTVTTGDVRVVCRLTVGGSFEARTSTLSGMLGAPSRAGEPMSGELAVDLNTLNTGIRLRDEHLRDNYLETGRGPGYTHAVLSNIQVTGMDLESRAGRGTFTGILQLHGTTRQVAGQIELRQSGGLPRVRATFPVLLPEFDIASPRYLGIGVRDEVVVNVTFYAVPAE